MKKNYKVIFIVLAVIVGAFFVIEGLVWLSDNNEAIKAQKTLTTYLEDKYDQDFVVEKPAPKGFGFGVEGVFRGTAHPKDNSDLKFEAWTSSYGSNDEYPGAYWQKQAYDYLKPSVVKTFGYEPKFKVEVFTANIEGKTIRGHLPTFSQALATYNDRINIKLTVSGRESIDTDGTKLLVAQRAFDLINQLKQTRAAVFSINYSGPMGGGLTYRDSKGKVTVSVNHAEDLLSIIKEGK